VLVRLPRRGGLIAARRRALVCALLAAAAAGACRRGADTAPLKVSWTLTPQPPAVGPATLALTVTDAAGAPVSTAAVRVEAQMTHAGMAPVTADATANPDTPGAYTARFAFTMAGDWVLLVSVVLPDGGRTTKRIDVRGVHATG
jgi:hypothetical protein